MHCLPVVSLFALKDLSLQLGAGVSLYSGIVNVAEAGYGEVSSEFEKIAKHVNSGMPMNLALEKIGNATKSDYFRRAIWQILNAMKAGASLKSAVQSIITDLTATQKTAIVDYSKELNIWILSYLMIAVAIPTIGIVMLIILSSFSGAGIDDKMFVIFLILTFIVQIVLIELIKSRRPAVIF